MHWVDAIGFAAGVLAFTIAIYLQIFVDKPIRPRYIIGFVWFGFGLFFITFRTNLLSSQTIAYLKALGYTFLIGLELYALKVALDDYER